VGCADVALAVEIESPHGRRRDRVWKAEAYAEAGIPRYWRVVPDAENGPEIAVSVLDGAGAVEPTLLIPGSPAKLEVPFPVVLDPADLIP
jgi:Uma2 family endonuclease